MGAARTAPCQTAGRQASRHRGPATTGSGAALRCGGSVPWAQAGSGPSNNISCPTPFSSASPSRESVAKNPDYRTEGYAYVVSIPPAQTTGCSVPTPPPACSRTAAPVTIRCRTRRSTPTRRPRRPTSTTSRTAAADRRGPAPPSSRCTGPTGRPSTTTTTRSWLDRSATAPRPTPRPPGRPSSRSPRARSPAVTWSGSDRPRTRRAPRGATPSAYGPRRVAPSSRAARSRDRCCPAATRSVPRSTAWTPWDGA